MLQEIYEHPQLNVIVCETHMGYALEDITVGEDGAHDYCTWCTDAGTLLLLCSNCPRVMCVECIEKNLGSEALNKLKNAGEN